jgi:hypothetical protein
MCTNAHRETLRPTNLAWRPGNIIAEVILPAKSLSSANLSGVFRGIACSRQRHPDNAIQKIASGFIDRQVTLEVTAQDAIEALHTYSCNLKLLKYGGPCRIRTYDQGIMS